MRKRAVVLSVLVALVAASFVAAPARLRLEDKFTLDSSHSRIGFSIRFMGLTDVEGRFKAYGGTILYDEADLTRSSIRVIIRTESIDTGSEGRDRHLRSPDFFDAAKFPWITFRGERIVKSGPGYAVTGPLEMHGVTKEVTIPFTMVHGRMKDMWENTRIGFLGTLKLDRREFGIVGPQTWEHVLDLGRLTIGNEVDITLNLQGLISNVGRFNYPQKSVAPVLAPIVEEKGVDAAIAQYRELKRTQSEAYDYGPWGMNTLGYKLLQRGKTREAIAIFKLNVEVNTDNANLWDSLGDGYLAAGQVAEALAAYKKAAELDPYNTSATEMVRHLNRN